MQPMMMKLLGAVAAAVASDVTIVDTHSSGLLDPFGKPDCVALAVPSEKPAWPQVRGSVRLTRPGLDFGWLLLIFEVEPGR